MRTQLSWRLRTAALLSLFVIAGCSKQESTPAPSPTASTKPAAAKPAQPAAAKPADPAKRAECEKACAAKKEARDRLSCRASCPN